MRWPRQISVPTIDTVERSGSLLLGLAKSGSNPNPASNPSFGRPPAGHAPARLSWQSNHAKPGGHTPCNFGGRAATPRLARHDHPLVRRSAPPLDRPPQQGLFWRPRLRFIKRPISLAERGGGTGSAGVAFMASPAE
jgi:hypothetical protein